MTNSVIIASASDRDSFLLPVLGFSDREAAESYIASCGTGSGLLSRDSLQPLHTSTRSYVPRFGYSSDAFDTNTVLGVPYLDKPIWRKLREKDSKRVEGSYNVALMVEGVRSFYRHVKHSASTSPHVYRIAEGPRDCYAVWSGCDGRDPIPVFTSGHAPDPEAPRNRVFAARSGRGVLYSRVCNFDTKGELSGFTLRVVQVEFSVLDRDPARDDMLRVRVTKQLANTYDLMDHPTVCKDGMDEAWLKLIDRAEAGFNRWCREMPEDVETWRKMFMEQRTKADADRTLIGTGNAASSFHDRVKALDWQSALAAVEEAWQLQVVVNVHCDSKFDDSPHYHDSNSRRVGNMLARVENAERRAELSQMVSDFVAPCDKLWSYVGD